VPRQRSCCRLPDTSRVTRRPDPARILTARRMAVRNVLASEGMAVETADARCDAWQGEGERLGLDRMAAEYWALGLAWIHEQRMRRKLPT
jgi:hypothetical protein